MTRKPHFPVRQPDTGVLEDACDHCGRVSEKTDDWLECPGCGELVCQDCVAIGEDMCVDCEDKEDSDAE